MKRAGPARLALPGVDYQMCLRQSVFAGPDHSRQDLARNCRLRVAE